MSAIVVDNVCRDFEYYEKETGLAGSFKNLFIRKKRIRHAVKDVSFRIAEGEMVGFIGPNGAGKTTTIKMLSGILYPTSGKALVNGFVPWERKDEFKRQFSYVAGQKSQLWNDLPANESFYLNKCIYELPDGAYRDALDELVDLFAVKDFLKVQVRKLSLGERMKMEMIAALLHKPRVIFLDEPTIGLDLVAQARIRGFLKEYNRRYRATIVVTSHYMQDIEELCRRSIIINSGSLVYDGELSGVCAAFAGKRVIRLSLSREMDKAHLARFGDVLDWDGIRGALEIGSAQLAAVSQRILNELPVADLSIEPVPLERSIAAIYAGTGA